MIQHIPRNIDLLLQMPIQLPSKHGATTNNHGGMTVYSPRWDNYGTLEASMLPDYTSASINGGV